MGILFFILAIIILWEACAIPFLRERGLYGTPPRQEQAEESRVQEEADGEKVRGL